MSVNMPFISNNILELISGLVGKDNVPADLSVDVAQAPEAILQTMRSFEFEAIVGMSFLRHFDVTLDMPNGTLTLE